MSSLLKGVFYPALARGVEAITMMGISKDDCFTIQSYDYKTEKELSVASLPGTENNAVWKVEVLSLSNGGMRELLSRFKSSDIFSYVFFFDADFDKFGKLSNYSSAVVVEGEISNLEEVFESDKANGEVVDRMRMLLTIAPHDVYFVGNSIDSFKKMSM